jgi:hypothetical protein
LSSCSKTTDFSRFSMRTSSSGFESLVCCLNYRAKKGHTDGILFLLCLSIDLLNIVILIKVGMFAQDVKPAIRFFHSMEEL